MIQIQNFQATWSKLIYCTLILAAALIVLAGIMNKWTDLRIRDRDVTIQALQVKIQQTQTVLGQLTFPDNVARVLNEVGWQVKTIEPRINTSEHE